MAIINKTGITNGGTIQAEHITRVIDALSGVSTDSIVATGSFSGTMSGIATSASFASTASYINTAQTASYVLNAVSASYATSASYEINYETSSSYAETASIATSASYANLAQTASYTLNSVSASFATSASRAISASFATTASHTPNTVVQGGNSFGTTTLIGTNDVQDLNLETSGSVRISISSSGAVSIGPSSAANGAGGVYIIPNGSLTTSGSENSTLLQFPTANGGAYSVVANVIARGVDSEFQIYRLGGQINSTFGNAGNILTRVGLTATTHSDFFNGAYVTLNNSGSAIRLQVYGESLTTIVWSGYIQYTRI